MLGIPTLRLADPTTAQAYPLPVTGPVTWRDGRLRLALADLTPGTLLVPSLASLPRIPGGSPAMHRWCLRRGADEWALQTVPSTREVATTAAEAGRAAGTGAVSTHVDCFRIHRQVAAPELVLEILGEPPPERYLVAVSRRPFTMAQPPLPDAAAALPRTPPERSQMTAPAAIAPRICSPTCVSMVLDLWDRDHDWLGVCEECHDAATEMYGVWPLALRAAARRGSLGAVEVFTEWREPLAVLAAGVPLVTSLRFAEGELPGAPLPETGGHLVVVHAVDQREVAVCDPAAEDGAVARRYPAEAFSRAWLRHRGAAYILPS